MQPRDFTQFWRLKDDPLTKQNFEKCPPPPQKKLFHFATADACQ